MKRALALGIALGVAALQARAGCGMDPLPCRVPDGSYHVVLPEAPGPVPAVVFLHGFGASGAGVLRNAGMVDTLIARGYAVIAPDGQPRRGRDGRSWDFHPQRPATRDEVAFIDAVADDAAARFGLLREDMLLAGFSIGGSMASYLACAAPDAFRAYAPVAGSFWLPQPVACEGPVQLLHTHGWADMTVPLEGRAVGSGLGLVQGDVFEALQTWRETNGCTRIRPDALSDEGDLRIRSWTECLPGGRLDLALHFGGHGIPPGWSRFALDWFESLP